MRFEKTYSLRTSDFDRYERLQASSILDLFQDVAGAHAEKLGIGHDSMLTNNYIWVLVKVKFQIINTPKMYDNVTVRTWPLAPGKLSFQREYQMIAENGDILVKGTSEWVVIHSEKRRIVSAIDAYPVKEGFMTDTMFDEKLTKIPNFDVTENAYEITPGYVDFDLNGHINNTKYANYVLNAVNPGENMEIDTLQIDFNKEIKTGTTLRIHLNKDNKTIFTKGESGENTKNFACHITLK